MNGNGHPPDDVIDVAPTKSLFVEMLTKDIGLGRAIIDLVDNSVDGARRLRPGKDADLTGLQITLTISSTEFRVKDNCGGIGLDLATKHAFRIGRPKGMPSTPNSVGQFGVGMKRALFKFGREFSVTSRTRTDSFEMAVDLDAWLEDEAWIFRFDDVKKDLDVPEAETGTEIVVTRLREGVRTAFELKSFINGLEREIAAAQQEYVGRGLTILVNGTAMLSKPWYLLQGAGILPAMTRQDLEVESGRVSVRVFAGVAEPSPQKAGWYIVCNGRMVLEADQSEVTGWGTLADTKDVVAPKYHNTFARFRGYAFFDSENAGLLPWNTTKTGVDGDSPLFRSVQSNMVQAMRPVIDFLKRCDDEREAPLEEKVLTSALSKTVQLSVRDIVRVGPFEQPTLAPRVGPRSVSIQYHRPADQIETLQQALHASSAREVGAMAFDLAYRRFGEV